MKNSSKAAVKNRTTKSTTENITSVYIWIIEMTKQISDINWVWRVFLAPSLISKIHWKTSLFSLINFIQSFLGSTSLLTHMLKQHTCTHVHAHMHSSISFGRYGRWSPTCKALTLCPTWLLRPHPPLSSPDPAAGVTTCLGGGGMYAEFRGEANAELKWAGGWAS